MSSLSALKRVAQKSGQRETPPSATAQLGLAMLEASLTRSMINSLKSGSGPRVLIVEADATAHVSIVADGLRCIVPDTSAVVELEAKSSSWQNGLLKAIRGNDQVIAVCPKGLAVPQYYRALADESVRVLPHDARALRRAVSRTLRKPVPDFPHGFVLHPDPRELCRCILPKFAPSKVIAALAKLGSEHRQAEPIEEALPPLEECVEFGEARAWGLDVVRDIASWSAGELDAKDLDTACLLVGPPGLGKTHFARVLASALGVSLIELTLGDIFVDDGNLGDVLQALRKRFDEAAAAAPAVLLLDELDSFSRRDTPDNNRSFTTALINDLLTHLDGASQRRPGLVVVGATNMPEMIDPALRRPGRLSRAITMRVPDALGVEHVLRVHLRGDLTDQSLAELARLGEGRTPAELAEAVRRSRQSARREQRGLLAADLAAELRSDSTGTNLHRRIALHEAGHALACLLIPEAPHLKSLSLVAGHGALGRVEVVDQDGPITKSLVEAKVMMLLAGRAAEDLFHAADPSAGAAQDLRSATDLVVQMHDVFGMAGKLSSHDSRPDSTTRAAVEADLARLMASVHDLLAEHKVHLSCLATALQDDIVLTAAEAAQIVETAGRLDSMEHVRALVIHGVGEARL